MILSNKNTNKQDFENIKDSITQKYRLKKENIKAVFVKELPSADLISANKKDTNGKTSHIACTGDSRNFFYPILGDIVANGTVSDRNTFDIYVETKYFSNQELIFKKSKCTIWINKKLNGENQIGLSKQEYDGNEFNELRKHMYKDDVIVFFKYLNEQNNSIHNYVILLKKDSEIDKKLIGRIGNLTRKPKYYEEINDELNVDICSDAESEVSNQVLKGINKIYFGAPGTGKSKYVNDTYYNKFAKRVTFHPEYTYNDFIGYIRPIVREDGSLTYKFLPGTFTEILVEALENPTNMYSLIIEELNRANTPAVFGDIFQLLDRKSNGVSEYRVNNIEIYGYIKEKLKENYKIENGSIYIPNNLNIIATMNTADQNIFVMDTAFKRRWEFEYLPVKFESTHPFKNNIISKLNIKWEDFVEIINKFMMSRENSSLMISEDKQIGPYFVKEEELNDCNKFGYKVFLYLWDDVFKMDRERIFNKDIRTFSDLITRFSNGEGINIFTSSISEKLKEHIVVNINEEEDLDA